MPITPRTLIYDAFRTLGVLRPGQQMSDDAVDDALRVLQDMVDSWNTERLMIYTIERGEYNLAAGTVNYTLGPGGSLGPVRPVRVEQAGLLRDSALEQPYPVLSLDGYRRHEYGVYIDGAFPAANVQVYPAPQGGERLALYGWQPLTSIALADASYSFPAGYALALRWNLADQLAPMARIQAKIPEVLYQQIVSQAVTSKAAIKSFHSSPPPEMDTGLGCGCSYNIYTDR